MEMREFGGTGIRASVIGLGCNNFGIYQDAGQAIAVAKVAASHGSRKETLPTVAAASLALIMIFLACGRTFIVPLH